MQLSEYIQPEYLFCEIEPKDGTFNDHRIWIYHRPSLSLIEFIYLNDIDDFHFEGLQKDYIYQGLEENDPEAYKGVFVQNNCEITDNDPIQVIDGAWKYLENYFKWEDQQ